ncbi:unnamed protein product [Trichogramma brassicae]|uniref:Uncharacterized protein n=1 Tax=Trichogramma brassicae TaxID=86971 RepID=A0A6H5ITT1_9HYME|nr:unnamed protein product [Trichogramma brassicae]
MKGLTKKTSEVNNSKKHENPVSSIQQAADRDICGTESAAILGVSITSSDAEDSEAIQESPHLAKAELLQQLEQELPWSWR